MNLLTLHILFLGVAVFQTLFFLMQWFFYQRREYLYYVAYIVSVILFLLFRMNDTPEMAVLTLPQWLRRITYQPLGLISYWMYLCFARNFLNLKCTQPQVYNYFKKVEYVLVGFIVLFILLIPFSLSNQQIAYIYLAGYISLFLLTVPCVVLMLKQKNLLNNFIIVGCLFFVLGGFTGMVYNYLLNRFSGSNLLVFVGLEIGILLEFILLITGFLLKNKLLQQQVNRGQAYLLMKQRY